MSWLVVVHLIVRPPRASVHAAHYGLVARGAQVERDSLEAHPKENTMRPKLLTQCLILAGSVALAIAQGIVLLFILLIMYWLHGSPGRSFLQSGSGAG